VFLREFRVITGIKGVSCDRDAAIGRDEVDGPRDPLGVGRGDRGRTSLAAAPGSVFERLLEKYFEGEPDGRTVGWLKDSGT